VLAGDPEHHSRWLLLDPTGVIAWVSVGGLSVAAKMIPDAYPGSAPYS
jgi:hypothetical protein